MWLAPAGGLLIGVHRDVRPGRGAFFELLRIEAQPDGGIAYVAQPMGGTATRFELVACGEAGGAEGRAVFENPAHDYPQRIVYAREGDTLVARIEGDVDGETKSSEWRWGLRK